MADLNLLLNPPSICKPVRKVSLSVKIEYTLDLDLVRQARGGDERAFEEILRRYSPRVFQIASKFLRERSLVEEIAQDVFLKTYVELGSYKGQGSLEGWISRIATNTCLNFLRKAKNRRESPVGDLTADESGFLENLAAPGSIRNAAAAEQSLLAGDLAQRVLEGLSPEDRLVLMLLDGDEVPVRAIAEITGWSQSNVKVRAMRARRKMRKAVEALLAACERTREGGK
ncbi:MAG: RNA polymerase sigma factor [Blastocatellia bacterium]